MATYQSLRKQGTPVKLLWQSWGHSNSTPAPGELDEVTPQNSYEGQVVLGWFDHYLKGTGAAPKLDFSYFRPWVTYTGIATPAYASSSAYPAAAATRLYLGSALGKTKPDQPVDPDVRRADRAGELLRDLRRRQRSRQRVDAVRRAGDVRVLEQRTAHVERRRRRNPQLSVVVSSPTAASAGPGWRSSPSCTTSAPPARSPSSTS